MTTPTGQVTWTVDVPAGADARVTFTPSTPLLHEPGVTVVLAAGHLESPDGTDLVTLAATDLTSPAGWTWCAHLRVDGRLMTSFPFHLPAGTVVDLADLVPVAVSPGVRILTGPRGPAGPPGPISDGWRPGTGMELRDSFAGYPAGAVPAGSTAEIASPAKVTSNVSAAPETSTVTVA